MHYLIILHLNNIIFFPSSLGLLSEEPVLQQKSPLDTLCLFLTDKLAYSKSLVGIILFTKFLITVKTPTTFPIFFIFFFCVCVCVCVYVCVCFYGPRLLLSHLNRTSLVT